MGDLADDIRVKGSDGRYVTTVSPDWEIWTPNGGYLSALALQAAAAETDLQRPAAYYCHYLRPARSGEDADLTVTTLRRTGRTHSLRVTMTQGDTLVLEAMVLAVVPPSALTYDEARMPDVPSPAELRSNEEIHAPDEAPFRFWNNLETRPVTWTGRWDERPVMHPLWRVWSRFRPRSTFADPFVDAARALILVDTNLYAAAAMAHEGTMPFLAPSMDLSVRFHHPAHDDDWLLSSSETPVGVQGLIGGYAGVWTQDGRLVATGGQQMFHLS